MQKVRNCIVCESDSLKELAKRKYQRPAEGPGCVPASGDIYRSEMLHFLFHLHLPDANDATFVVELCRECGMVFSNPRFPPEEIAERFGMLSCIQNLWEYGKSIPPLKTEERANRIYKLVSGPMNDRQRSMSVLDYGGSQGFNLVPFTARYNCYLVDYVEHEIPFGVERIGKDVNDLRQEMQFDLILLCHVLEHVTHPVELLSRLVGLLKEGGKLYVEVPLGAFREWRVFSEPLTHVNFFSEESLWRCLTKSGLSVSHISTDFQWVTRRRDWCINAIGTRGGDDRIPVEFRCTKRQMCDPIYYLKWGLERLEEKVRARF